MEKQTAIEKFKIACNSKNGLQIRNNFKNKSDKSVFELEDEKGSTAFRINKQKQMLLVFENMSCGPNEFKQKQSYIELSISELNELETLYLSVD